MKKEFFHIKIIVAEVVEIEEDKIVLKPFKDLAGKLEKYGKKNKNLEEIIEEENQALEKAFCEKHNS